LKERRQRIAALEAENDTSAPRTCPSNCMVARRLGML
jgi:hypothetical protein